VQHVPGMPTTGTIFADRYEILDAVGRGGTAVVYRARDLRHDRFVALKVLHRELTQSMSADRFVREIGIAAKLTHPNILALYDSGDSAGFFYYVTPFIEGESLRERLQRDVRLSIRDAIGIARGVAAALDYAHGRGIVHRDIKPENILLVGGQPLVADFGIARILEPGGDARMTSTGMIVGTPAYMSPEQAAGELDVGPRSDLYSFGCVLYEMLAGEAPFRGATSAAVIAARFAHDPPDLRDVRPEAPALLAEIAGALLARGMDERLQTAAELHRLLDAVEPDITAVSQAMLGRTRRRISFRRRVGDRRLLAAAALVVLLGGGYLARYAPGGLTGRQRIQKLAVLPLINLSGDIHQEFLADGLTEGLITDLMRLPKVTVISRTSVMQYKLLRKSAPEVAAELNVDAVVEASFTREGERIIITAGLVSGRDGRALWRDIYVGSADSIFALQRRVSSEVARQIGARMGLALDQPVVKSESVEHYLRGASYAAQWRLEEAIAALQRAVEIDPANAQAYAAFARAHYFRAQFGEVNPHEAFGQMRRAAAAAIARDPELGEAHGLMALVNTHYDFDWAGAEANFLKALQLSPSNAQVHHDYAHFLLAMGRGAESVEASRKAVVLDPTNAMLISCLGWHSLFENRFEESLRHAGEAQKLMPSFWAQVVQGWALTGIGDAEAAVETLRDAVELNPDLAFTRAALAHALGRNGHTAEARQILAELVAWERQAYVSPYDIALVYAGLGDHDRAFDWINKAIFERSSFVVHLTWDSRLDPLRNDRRFDELVERLRIPSATQRATQRATIGRSITMGEPAPLQRSSSQPAATASNRLAVKPAHMSARARGVPLPPKVRSMRPARMS
jgi:eukaryotic-like serine/threonine-protein kinase